MAAQLQTGLAGQDGGTADKNCPVHLESDPSVKSWH